MSARNKNKNPNQRYDGDSVIDKPWAINLDDVIGEFSTNPDRGLSKDEAGNRLSKYGPNRIEQKEKTSWWKILLNQFESLVILILVAASIVSFAFGRVPEGIAVSIVVIINAIIGFITEFRATRSMEALQKMSRTEARVIRSGDDDKV
ncbi:MAG: cation-transporting P-type ATPase, partial [Desulfofustis sp.]